MRRNGMKNGASLIWAMVVMTALLAMASLAVDYARVQVAKTELRRANLRAYGTASPPDLAPLPLNRFVLTADVSVSRGLAEKCICGRTEDWAPRSSG